MHSPWETSAFLAEHDHEERTRRKTAAADALDAARLKAFSPLPWPRSAADGVSAAEVEDIVRRVIQEELDAERERRELPAEYARLTREFDLRHRRGK